MVVPREMREWIASFAPDVVYSLLGSVRMMRLARLVGTVADAPVIPHFMDDWPSTLYSQGELAGAARRTALRELDAIVRRAPAALTISTAMADEYATRFGRSFEVFGNPVDVLPAPPRLTAAGSPLTLLYIGGLHLERWKTIRDIGQSLDARDARARPWKVRVHAPAKDVARYGQAFSGICSVEIAETLAPIDVPSALASGDVLLHVESFDPVITRHTRLSLSTKLPQYLAAGRPVLAIGPGANASISLIERTGAGIVAEDPSMRGLGQALARLEDQRTRTEMARRGVVVANRDYSRTAVRNRLREVLTQASGSR